MVFFTSNIALTAGILIGLSIYAAGCKSSGHASSKPDCDSILGKVPGPNPLPPLTGPTSNGAFGGNFDEDLEAFNDRENADEDGLGPVFNADSCAVCHQNTAFGETSQVSVIRAGHRYKRTFVEPPGGSLIFQRAIHPDIQEHVRSVDEVRTLRMTTNVLGDGFIECVPDQAIFDVQKHQPAKMRGTILLNPAPVKPKPQNAPPDTYFIERVGRFGWKCQDSSLLAFAAGAYLNEMGITSPLQPTENTSLGRDTGPYNPVLAAKPIQDTGGAQGFGEDVEKFTRFMRNSNPPPRASNLDADKVKRGGEVFNSIQCAVCHVPEWKTGGTDVDLGDRKVPAELANKAFHPYSDFMLHDVGSGDGIVQTQHAQRPPYGCDDEDGSVKPSLGKHIDAKAHPQVHRVIEDMYRYVREENNPRVRQKNNKYDNGNYGQRYMETGLVDTANMIRTAPLWGVRARPQLMHDGLSLTLDEAIRRHANQGAGPKNAYLKLSLDDRCALLTYLMSL
jgi:CxxC motif-containing protein (DUF1111 family)